MKRNKLLILALILTSFLFFISFPVKADSGFDSDFGSSSSDFGSSDYSSSDFGSSDSGYSSSGGINSVSDFIIIIIFSIIMFYVFFRLVFNFSSSSSSNSNSKMLASEILSLKLPDEEVIKQLGEKFNYEEFKQLVFDNYKKIQLAWQENTIEDVRDLLSDTIFNTYKTQLLTLSNKNQKNMMEDIKYQDAFITKIQKEGIKEEIEVSLIVTCRDYIINKDTNQVLRGDKNKINKYYYKLTFEKTSDSDIKYCPNCGAKLPKGNSAKCEYCKSIIVKKTNNYILTDKKMLRQE